jgi:hypothetical protein
MRSLNTLLTSLLASVNAFYPPGAAPHDYASGEKVDLFVNALTPTLPSGAKLVCSYWGLLYFSINTLIEIAYKLCGIHNTT